LWKATRDLVKGAEQTAERQLRAYVFVDVAEIRNFGTSEPMQGVVKIKNSEQTPAYKLSGWTRIASDVSDVSKPEKSSKIDLGPGGEVFYYAAANRTLTADEVSLVIKVLPSMFTVKSLTPMLLRSNDIPSSD
jgi:hypothetical protein